MVRAVAITMTTVGTVPPPKPDCGATTVDNGSNCGGSWDRGEAVTQRGRSTPSTAAMGGGLLARQRQQQQRANKRHCWPQRWLQQQQLYVVPHPTGRGLRGQAASRAARVRTTLQRGRTAGSLTMMTGGLAGGGEAPTKTTKRKITTAVGGWWERWHWFRQRGGGGVIALCFAPPPLPSTDPTRPWAVKTTINKQQG